MKSLNNYILESKDINEPKESGQIISLEGIDEELISKINNLKDNPIYECCGCGCCCDPTPCDSCAKCCEPKSFGFTSEWQVVDTLSFMPNVDNLFQIHWQFGNKFMFHSENEPALKEPLYFNGSVEYSMPREPKGKAGELVQPNVIPATPFNKNQKLYDFIKDLCKTFDMNYPIALEKNGIVQLFFVKYTGDNKIEGSIKDSLTEVAKVLGKLDDKSEVTWSQVLNVSIDNLDDLYYFLITCKIDMTKFNK